jgi:hypothetical protein
VVAPPARPPASRVARAGRSTAPAQAGRAATAAGVARARRPAARLLRPLFALGLVVTTASCAREEAGEPGVERMPEDAAQAAAAFDVVVQPQDSLIFHEKMAWALEQRLDTLPVGDAIVALGRTFVGAPYEPGTLELDGPERLIVNLRELDCVTYVETVLAMVRMLRAGTTDFDSFQRELLRIRYRDGVLAGYPSRLHYFSEWIANNHEKGIVRDVTTELGGRRDARDITFMTRNPDAYRQFSDTGVAGQIRSIELELSGRERFYIPQDGVAAVERDIRNGDIIAARSTLDGLDIAHTGFAIWIGNRLHLMHAPLVGSVIEISERPLAERLQRIDAQDGIMVARPL